METMVAIEPQYLIAVGMIFIAIEILSFSFFLFPIGIGFIITAIVHYYLFAFDNMFYQFAFAFSLGLFLLVLFRKKLIILMNKGSSETEQKIHESGIGIIDDKQIKFSGTYWNTNSDLSKYKNGDKVNIVIEDNMAIIKEIK